MKLKFVKILFVFLFALFVSYRGYIYHNSNAISLLMVENIEALAGGEGGSTGCCPSVGSICFSDGVILADHEICGF
ncbi:NVEALA domain-containing protein [Phocaeicola sp.]